MLSFFLLFSFLFFSTEDNVWCVCCGEGNGTSLQYFCLENPMDGGAWWATVHGVVKSQIWLSNFTFTFHFHALDKEMANHSSALCWRIPGMGKPGGLQSMESHRVGHDWSDLTAAAVFVVYGFYYVEVCSFSAISKPRTSRCPRWFYKRQRNQRSNCQHPLDHQTAREFQKNIYFCFIDYAKAFDCVYHNKLWKILEEREYQTTWPASW